MFGKDPIRLSIRPLGGQGQPYGDDVVEAVRKLVVETRLSQTEIGALAGVSNLTVSRWIRLGGWTRPAGTFRHYRRMLADPYSDSRGISRVRAWGLLREAETLIAEPVTDGTSLDRMERALGLVLEAREVHGQAARRTRKAA